MLIFTYRKSTVIILRSVPDATSITTYIPGRDSWHYPYPHSIEKFRKSSSSPYLPSSTLEVSLTLFGTNSTKKSSSQSFSKLFASWSAFVDPDTADSWEATNISGTQISIPFETGMFLDCVWRRLSSRSLSRSSIRAWATDVSISDESALICNLRILVAFDVMVPVWSFEGVCVVGHGCTFSKWLGGNEVPVSWGLLVISQCVSTRKPGWPSRRRNLWIVWE